MSSVTGCVCGAGPTAVHAVGTAHIATATLPRVALRDVMSRVRVDPPSTASLVDCALSSSSSSRLPLYLPPAGISLYTLRELG